MDDHPVHTRPFQTPLKMDVLAKTFLHIILAAKWLVRYSSIRELVGDDDLTFCVHLIL